MGLVAVLGIVVSVLLTVPDARRINDVTLIRLGKLLIAASILVALLAEDVGPMPPVLGGDSDGDGAAASPATSGYVPGRVPVAFLN